MVSEHKVVKSLHDVFLVFGVLFIESFDQLRLDETLLVETFLILKNFQSHKLLLFVIKNTQHDAKGPLSELLDNLIPVAQMLIIAMDILLLICVKAMIVLFVDLSILGSSCQTVITSVFYSFLDVKEIDYVVLEDLFFLIFPKIGGKKANGIVSGKREFDLVGALRCYLALF